MTSGVGAVVSKRVDQYLVRSRCLVRRRGCRFYHEAPVILWEECTLTEEEVSCRATRLLSQGSVLVLTGLFGADRRITPATLKGATKIINQRCVKHGFP